MRFYRTHFHSSICPASKWLRCFCNCVCMKHIKCFIKQKSNIIFVYVLYCAVYLLWHKCISITPVFFKMLNTFRNEILYSMYLGFFQTVRASLLGSKEKLLGSKSKAQIWNKFQIFSLS